MLLERYGFRRAAGNRFGRIVVPFVVGWLVVFPLSMLLAGTGLYNFDIALEFIVSGRILAYAHPLHLWFLEYLIVLYLLAAAVVVLMPLVSTEKARETGLHLFRRVVLSPWGPLVLAVPSFSLAQLLMPQPWIEDPPSFIPVMRIVAVYAIPFAFGWLLFHCTDLLDVLSRRAWLNASLAVAATVAYQLSYGLPVDRQVAFYLIRVLHSVAMWLLILGVAGLFLRYLSGCCRPSPRRCWHWRAPSRSCCQSTGGLSGRPSSVRCSTADDIRCRSGRRWKGRRNAVRRWDRRRSGRRAARP